MLQHDTKNLVLIISLLQLFILKSAFATIFLDTSAFIESSLQLEHTKTNFQFTNFRSKVTLDRLGIDWYEPLSTSFHGGVELGYLDFSLAQSTLSGPVFASGRYLGLVFRYVPLNTKTLDIDVSLHYRYSDINSTSSTPQMELIWHESRFSTNIGYHLTSRLSLDVSADYRIIDGEQRISGASLEEFEEASKEGYRAGIGYKVNRSGYIKLEWLGGYQQGARMNFSRYF